MQHFLLALIVTLVIGQWPAYGQIADAAAGAQAALQAMRAERFAVTKPLLLFGGDNYETFLGCLNCPDTDPSSILNPYGAGNAYSPKSIHNQYSQFGSPYGLYSPCNRYGIKAPVVVDRQGGFYGHFTINRYHLQRFEHAYFNTWLAGLCQSK